MAQLICIGILHTENLYDKIIEVLKEEKPDGILLESHIISLYNLDEVAKMLSGSKDEAAERRIELFLKQKLKVKYKRFKRDIEMIKESKESDVWKDIENYDSSYKNILRNLAIDRRLFNNIPAVRVNIGDFIYYDGHAFEENAGIAYALDNKIPWYAVDIPLLVPLDSLDFLRFNGKEYLIVSCPIEQDELQETPLNNIYKVRTKNNVEYLSWQESDQIRNTYAARAAEKIYQLFKHRKLAIIYGDRHFNQETLIKKLGRRFNLPNTISELAGLDTFYRNVYELNI